MRKLLTFLIAVIFSIAVSASSFGGSLTRLGVRGASLSLARVSHAEDSAGGTTITYSSLSFGAADPDRIIAVCGSGERRVGAVKILHCDFRYHANPIGANPSGVAIIISTGNTLALENEQRLVSLKKSRWRQWAGLHCNASGNQPGICSSGSESPAMGNP